MRPGDPVSGEGLNGGVSRSTGRPEVGLSPLIRGLGGKDEPSNERLDEVVGLLCTGEVTGGATFPAGRLNAGSLVGTGRADVLWIFIAFREFDVKNLVKEGVEKCSYDVHLFDLQVMPCYNCKQPFVAH